MGPWPLRVARLVVAAALLLAGALALLRLAAPPTSPAPAVAVRTHLVPPSLAPAWCGPLDAAGAAAAALPPAEHFTVGAARRVRGADGGGGDGGGAEYELTIAPLRVFGCAPGCRRVPACAPAAVFEVPVAGPALRLAGDVTPPDEADADVRWTVRVRVPPGAPGAYTATVRLMFLNYTHASASHSCAMRTACWDELRGTPPSARALWPDKQYDAVVATVRIDVDAAAVGPADAFAMRRAALPWCAHLRPPALPGAWDAAFVNFYPHACRLIGLRANATEGTEHAARLRRTLEGRWVNVFGDSNARHWFYPFCSLLGATGWHKKPDEHNRKGDSVHVCFRIEPPAFVIALRMWWPSSFPTLDCFLSQPARAVLSEAHFNETAGTGPSRAFWGRARPDLVIISAGSHDFHTVVHQPELYRTFFAGADPPLNGPDAASKLAFVDVTATNSLWIPANVPNTSLSFVMQNNVRVQLINNNIRAAFPPPLYTHVDAWSISLPPNLFTYVSDAVHLHPTVMKVLSETIVNYIAELLVPGFAAAAANL